MSERQAPNRQILGSWKEIANFLGRRVRTVQVWEKDEGMPVHRHPHRRQSSVYAYTDELEAWWRQHELGLPQNENSARWMRFAWVAVLLTVAVTLTGWALWASIFRTDFRTKPPVSAVFAAFVLDGIKAQGGLDEPRTGDVDGDGRADLILSATTGAEAYILFGGSAITGPTLAAASGTVIRGAPRHYFGIRQVGDFNSDGIDDLLISENLPEPESFHTFGRSFLLWGRRTWAKEITLPQDADVTLRLDAGAEPRMRGCLMPGWGADFNGDGIADVFLGAMETGPAGRAAAGMVFVLYGRPQWPQEMEVSSRADLIVPGRVPGDGLGAACALADVHGIGRPDLLLYAAENTLWFMRGGRGTALLHHASSKPTGQVSVADHSELRAQGPILKSKMPTMLAADFNGDGRSDFAVGWPATYAEDSSAYPGEVHIWMGSQTFTAGTTNADVVIRGSRSGAQLGTALAAHDFDGDGIADLVVSEPGTGTVYMLFGRRAWPPSGDVAVFRPATLHKNVGWRGGSIIATDLDGDQLPEIIFTVPEMITGMPPTPVGRAWIVKPYLAARVDVRPEMEPNVVLLGSGYSAVRIYGSSHPPGEELLPESIRAAGVAPERYVVRDFNGDGLPDVQAYFNNARLKLDPQVSQLTIFARTRNGLLAAGSDAVSLVLPSPVGIQP